MPEAAPRYPIHLDLRERRVLLVGAGAVGRRRLAALLEAGARVRWVAPDLPACGDTVERLSEPFHPRHLDSVCLALGCATPAVNAALVRAARAAGIWVGAAAGPSGDFLVPARVRQGRLLISIGTGGAAPAASRAIRSALEALTPPWAEEVERLAQARGAPARGEQR